MFVAIEGIDGAGKHTLCTALCAKAAASGLRCADISFPRYGDTAFGGLIGRYLNGHFGRLDEVSPYFAGLLYAGDRFESREVLARLLQKNDLVIADRYVASNLAYNAAKLDREDRAAFIDRLTEIEHAAFTLPKPDLYVLLDLPADRSPGMVTRKSTRAYTDAKQDLHEENVAFLAAAAEVYRMLAERAYTAPWARVAVIDEAGNLRPPEAIAEEAWRAIVARAAVETEQDAG